MPADNTELLAECNTLLPLKGTLAGSAVLNWSDDTPIGSWNGITLGGSPLRVTGLVLPSSYLTGTIPGDLGKLDKLETLNLSSNQLKNAIPSDLGDLSNLVTLNLSVNQLRGPIPPALDGLGKLETLNLSRNQHGGTIPDELGDLSSLETLDLSANQLQGVIPSDLGGLSSLLTLNLSDNSLGGSIPSNLGNLSNLTGLNLSGNELDWEIPEELNQLDTLKEVSLNGNRGLIGPAHLDFTALSKVHLGYMETETWAVADFSSGTTWSLSGADSSKFTITNDGVLTFTSPPDHDVPSDSDSNNVYIVKLTAIGGTGNPAEIEVTVIDRDIALSVSPDSIVEEGTSTQFTITATLDGTTQITDTTISLSLSGTATGSGTDYTTVLLPSEMTIPAGFASGTATLTIRPEDDAIVEGEETISIEGTFSNDTVSPAWITINDADQGKLSLSGSVTAASEGGNDASYTVTLSHAIGHKVTVGWSLTPDSGDFSTPSGTVTFVAGSTAGATITLTLTPTDDLLSEVEESFSVMLGTITGEISDSMIVDTQANSAGLTIDASDPITVTLSGDSSVEEGDSASYTVSLSPDGVTPTANLTVDYDTADGTAGSADYAGVSEPLTFTSSDAAAKTVAVQTTEDSIAEGDETFSFTLSNVAGGGGPTPSLGDPSSITTTIDDDDGEPTAITLSVDPDEVSEEDSVDTTVTLTATLDGETTRNTATTISLSLSGTATGSGTDYTAGLLPSEMTILAGDTTGTATLTITPEDDVIVEGEETIRVEGTVSGFTVSPAWITINDDDRGELSISGSGTAVSEGNDASYTVSLSHAIDHEVTVGWSVTPDTGDFSTASGSVTFEAGSPANATMPLALTATDDLLSEVLESFSVMLGTVTGDISDRISVDADASSAVVMIAASDQITVTLSGDSSVNEGESATTRRVWGPAARLPQL